MKVLLVEDNPIDVKLMRAVLQGDGHEVLVRHSAEGVIEAVQRCRPEIILLDLNLPGVDGLTLAHDLRERTDTAHIPIVAMTAYPIHYYKPAVIAAGCAACIIKPINIRDLVTELRAIAARGSAGRLQ